MSFSSLLFSQSTIKSDSKEIKVYVFLSETCPICQSYTLTLKKLYNKYNSQNVVFIAVFSNYYSSSDNIQAFQKKYDFPFETILDQQGLVAKELGATITPEVFIQNEEGKTVYSGRIDDTFYAIGKRRNVIKSNDLEDALSQLISKQPIKNPKTKAVGCVITTGSK